MPLYHVYTLCLANNITYPKKLVDFLNHKLLFLEVGSSADFTASLTPETRSRIPLTLQVVGRGFVHGPKASSLFLFDEVEGEDRAAALRNLKARTRGRMHALPLSTQLHADRGLENAWNTLPR